MKRIVIFAVVASLLFSGCSVFSNSYVSVTPHKNSTDSAENQMISASDYRQLRTAFVDLVHSGAESGIIHVANYDPTQLEKGLRDAAEYVRKSDAIGAYAVESIDYEAGTIGVIPAVAVSIRYLHDRRAIQQIQTVRGADALWNLMETALIRCEPGIVVYVEAYTDRDLVQLVEDFGAENPDKIMEIPQVSCEVYPETGAARVVEIKFTYQNSRTDLRQMQSQVQPIFNSAALYVSGGTDYQKLSRLYSFLMERFGEYQLKTSITPAYSLLHHGVGDSRAFAVVYAKMCRMAGLDIQIVTGTRQGEPWTWNIVKSDESYFHVDLLCSHSDSGFALLTDEQMADYVWDYSAYPACVEIASETTEETGSEKNSE